MVTDGHHGCPAPTRSIVPGPHALTSVRQAPPPAAAAAPPTSLHAAHLSQASPPDPVTLRLFETIDTYGRSWDLDISPSHHTAAIASALWFYSQLVAVVGVGCFRHAVRRRRAPTRLGSAQQSRCCPSASTSDRSASCRPRAPPSTSSASTTPSSTSHSTPCASHFTLSLSPLGPNLCAGLWPAQSRLPVRRAAAHLSPKRRPHQRAGTVIASC
jgi:hypothetical protein